jgi:predicted alpha/beta superfamily hydrolase
VDLLEVSAGLSSVLPTTTYFEIESAAVSARFAVWVTLPLRYAVEDIDYPVIFQTDGNKAAPTTVPAFGLLRDDPINPIKPFIQVSVGYVGEDVPRRLAVRARDLLPPGEPLPAGADESTLHVLPAAGILSEADARLYLENLRNPRADRFLAFLIEELDPALRSRFRAGDAGLHGYSYGGLFAVYAALSTDHFTCVGAGSPGIQGNSQVFTLCDEAAASAGPTAQHLHLTMCERELTHPSIYQDQVAAGTCELLRRTGRNPVKGMQVTSALTPLESHATGDAAAWFSFLRTCYSASGPTDTLTRRSAS